MFTNTKLYKIVFVSVISVVYCRTKSINFNYRHYSNINYILFGWISENKFLLFWLVNQCGVLEACFNSIRVSKQNYVVKFVMLILTSRFNKFFMYYLSNHVSFPIFRQSSRSLQPSLQRFANLTHFLDSQSWKTNKSFENSNDQYWTVSLHASLIQPGSINS